MYKKTLLSLAVASSLGLTGCFDDADSGARNADPDYLITDTTIDTSLVRPTFNPILTAPDFDVPANYDLVLLLGAGRSPNYDFTGFTTGTDPASNAINDLAGFSISSPIDIRFNASIDPNSVVLGDTVHLVPLNMLPVSANTPDIELTANPGFIDLTNPQGGSAFDFATQLAQNVRVEVLSLDGGSNNTIRVTPLEPLEDQTKYLVVVTSGVLGEDGQPTAQSIAYQQMAGDGALGNPAFSTIRDVVQGGQALAQGWLAANANSDDVTLAYTFTTQNTRTVMNSITSPATYFNTLGQQIALYSALQIARESLPEGTPASDVFAAVTDALGASPENPELALQIGTAIAPFVTNPTINTGSGTAPFTSALIGSAAGTLPFPQPRTAVFYDAETVEAKMLDAIANSGSTPLIGAASFVKVAQGAIELPYYLELPGEDGTGIVKGVWRGNTDLETTLNNTITGLKALNPTELGNLSDFEFPRDSDDTFNVTQYMPFPQQNAKVAVPVTVFYPDSSNPTVEGAGCTAGTISDVVIFQHGITVDRSVSMIPAINIIAQSLGSACTAVVAIDQPIHGLGGSTVGTLQGLTPGQDYIDPADFDADFVGERHFNYTAKPNTLTPEFKSDITEVSSGSLAINIQSLQTMRDTLRQGVLDLLNLSATIKSGAFDIDGIPNGGEFNPASLQGADFHLVGHSLGGINGTPFAALVEDTSLRGAYAGLNAANPAVPADGFYPDLTSISLMNTGSQLSRISENSPSFAPQILGGLSGATDGRVVQGTSDLETFLYVWQSALDSTDPVSFAESLGQSYSLARADEWINPASGVQEPYPFGPVPDTSILISEVVGDLTVPNEANVSPLGQALSAPLAGTEPLMALVNLGAGIEPLTSGSIVSATSPIEIGAAANAASFFFGQEYCTDANHSTFVVPANPEDPLCTNGSTTGDAFNEMIFEVIGNIKDQEIPVRDTSVLADSPTLVNALDQDK